MHITVHKLLPDSGNTWTWMGLHGLETLLSTSWYTITECDY